MQHHVVDVEDRRLCMAVELQTIYDDVAGLMARVAALEASMVNVQGQLSSVGVITLVEDQDIHELSEGTYLIPSTAVSSTLLNKPDGIGNPTGIIKVVSGGVDGQKTVYFMPCVKTNPSYYYAAYYQSTWGPWNTINLIDSGWIDLPLATGITEYSDGQKPRYRKVGKEVFISGVLKGVTERDKLIATLPANYRPSKKVMLPIACVGQMIGKISVETNGDIYLNRTTVEPVVAENWHSIACSFNVD